MNKNDQIRYKNQTAARVFCSEKTEKTVSFLTVSQHEETDGTPFAI